MRETRDRGDLRWVGRFIASERPSSRKVIRSRCMVTRVGLASTRQGAADPLLLEEISHGLRSPLTSIITYLSLLEMRLAKAAREGDAGAEVRGYAELESAALADAYRMGAELDRLFARPGRSDAPPSRPSIIAPQSLAMGDRRFDRLWEAWDARLHGGEPQLDVLKAQTERDLAELLAADAGANRRLERNIIATELTNRLARRHRPLSDALTAAMARSIASASRTSLHTRRLILDSALDRAKNAERRAERATRREAEAGR